MDKLVARLRENQFVVAVVFALVLVAVFMVHQVIYLVFIAFLVATGLRPVVDRLVKLKFPRPLAVVLVYLALLASIAGLAYLFVPKITEQINSFSAKFPSYFGGHTLAEALNKAIDAIKQNGSQAAQLAATFSKDALGLLVSAVTVLIVSIYWLLDYRRVNDTIAGWFGRKDQSKRVLAQVESRLGGWVRGQLLLSLAVGIFSFIGYQIIGLPLSGPLGVVAGVLESVPVLGPIIAAGLALLIGLTVSLDKALLALLVALIVQQLENHILVPNIMRRTVGLHPIAVILVLLAGSKLAGVVGVVLAIPTTILVQSVIAARKQPAS